MTNIHPWTILRRQQVQAATGYSRSTIYAHMAQGLWPRPVNLGARARGWPTSEVAAVMAARIAGKSDAQIREIVLQLEQERANAC